MRLTHFESFKPVCPRCRATGASDSRVVVGSVIRESPGELHEGILNCPSCLMEYPVLDGIPYLVADLRSYVRENLTHMLARTDVSGLLEGLLGDAAGPGTYYEIARQFTSSYVWDHWSEYDGSEAAPTEEGGPRPGGVARHLATGLGRLGWVPTAGLTLDLGCSVGRSTFEVAARQTGLVLGGDLNVPMLRLARRILDTGRVTYARRRVGLVYDERSFPVPLSGADRVDFWAFNASEPPFAAGCIDLITAFNVLDCVPSAHAFLEGTQKVLAANGGALITTPYDWSAGATPYESWVGGHSQRGPWAGASEPFIRALLTPGAHPHSLSGLEIVADLDVPWHVRMHDRSMVLYRSHMLALRRAGTAQVRETGDDEAACSPG